MVPFLLALSLLVPSAAAERLLDRRAPRRPWRTWEAHSEQHYPVYLGRTPLELALKRPARPASLPEDVRGEGEAQARRLLERLRVQEAEIEGWPALDDEGRLTFAFARWRPPGEKAWRWLSGEDAAPEGRTPALLPRTYRTWVPEEALEVFLDFSLRPDLYGKPAFGDCLWTDESGRLLEAWPAPDDREDYERALKRSGERRVCRALNQPAVLDGRPRSFLLRAGPEGVRWPAELSWSLEPAPPPGEEVRPRLAWPANFRDAYRESVRALSGEAEVVVRGRRLSLERKSAAEAGHQLENVVDYLEERYAALGLATRRQRFAWRGLPQSNLVAVLPGTLKGRANRPVVLADHIDTAFAADVFRETGRRVSVPGADDNASGAAALLAAARVLKDVPRRHDVWLAHLTAEEFPADSLGARRWTRELLRRRQELGGVLVVDMIGWRDPGDRVFQVNPGGSEASARIGSAAMALAQALAPGWEPRLRPRRDPRSYLYNTDAVVFDQAGYPVVLFNEHVNALHNIDRPHYHESTDDSSRMDFDLAETLSRVAIETAALLADRP